MIKNLFNREEAPGSEDKLAKSSDIVAKKIVDHYKLMFDYLDYKPVDNLLTPEELSEAFKDFSNLKIFKSIQTGLK
jgi:hypothetical protein